MWILSGELFCAKCSSVGTNLVPSYGSAYLRAGSAENARIDALDVEGRSVVGRNEHLAAVRPACRNSDAAICESVNKTEEILEIFTRSQMF